MRTLQLGLVILFSYFGFSQTLKLNKENNHYLDYKGKPILLITSAEPYGAVLNKDFDFNLYLKTLHEEGMNYTRIFMGAYAEVPGSFGMDFNSIIPAVGSFITPWKTTNESGLYKGEKKIDFNQWNPNYFNRLHDFVATAAKYDIIVEITFFCATYGESFWERHPFNDQNNVNNLTPSKRLEFNTLKNHKVVHYQKKMVEKVTQELNKYDNIFFEISNEPWSDFNERVAYLHKSIIPEEKHQHVLWARTAPKEVLEWQKELAATFRETESKLQKKHLLAQNYSDMFESLVEVDEQIDILNFHYAWPEIVTANYGWNRPINYDETGFAGTADSTYLKQAWSFMLNGGAVFNNLDYSFHVGNENGTGVNSKAPGGGSKKLRKQLRFLRVFLEKFQFVKMRPATHLITHVPGMEYYCLAQEGKEYAIYLEGRNQGYAVLNLDKGNYQVTVYDPETGTLLDTYKLIVSESETRIKIPKRTRIAVAITSL